MKHFIKNTSVFILFFVYSQIMIIPTLIAEKLLGIDAFENGIIFIGVDLLLMIILYLIYRKDLKKEFKDLKKNYKNYIEVTLKFWTIGLIIMSITNVLIIQLTPSDLAGNEEAVRNLYKAIPVYTAFTTVLYAPFVEELVFRKAISHLFEKEWVYILISGIVFGTVHVIYSMNDFYSLLYIIPYGVLGSAFAYIHTKTNNIFTTMIMHSIHNGILMIVMALSLAL